MKELNAFPRSVATIDVGTNTALLLISTWKDGKLQVLHDETRFVRLGEGVDRSGLVNDAAIGRLIDTLNHYRQVMQGFEVQDIVIGATSASRDAGNQQVLIDSVKRHTGMDYGILTGAEEAEWSFAGVVAGMQQSSLAVMSIDIGGGSTELTLGRRNGKEVTVDIGRSLDVGSVRLTEKFFTQQPPTSAMVDQSVLWLNDLLTHLPEVYQSKDAMLVGASGTTNVLGLLEMSATAGPDYSDDLKEQSILGEISREKVRGWRDKLLKMNSAEVLALNPRFMKGREDVFPAGVMILHEIMCYLNKESVLVNTWGLRHGLALRHWANR